MAFVDNDRWGGRFPVHRNCRYFYTIEAWRDLFESWRAEVMKKHDAGLDVGLELIEGAPDRADRGAGGRARTARRCRRCSASWQRSGGRSGRAAAPHAREEVRALMSRAGIRTNASRYAHELEVFVDRPLAKFAAWYEMFPRSQSGDPNRHGTFDDVIERLPYVQGMGFDVLYFTPIHPIGRANRKGRNNTLTPGPDDPGSPYAIGSARKAATTRSTPSSAPSTTSTGWSTPPTPTAWRSRSTSRSSARPTIRGSRSIRSGSTGARTAPSSTPRTRPRSTRTSSTSTSIAGRCRRSGTRCATSCCSGSATA